MAIGTGGSAALTLSTSAPTDVLVAWTDGTDSYLTLVEASGAADTLLTFMGVDLRVTAQLLTPTEN